MILTTLQCFSSSNSWQVYVYLSTWFDSSMSSPQLDLVSQDLRYRRLRVYVVVVVVVVATPLDCAPTKSGRYSTASIFESAETSHNRLSIEEWSV